MYMYMYMFMLLTRAQPHVGLTSFSAIQTLERERERERESFISATHRQLGTCENRSAMIFFVLFTEYYTVLLRTISFEMKI